MAFEFLQAFVMFYVDRSEFDRALTSVHVACAYPAR